MNQTLRYLVPIAEVFTVLIIGNILASLLLSGFIDPELMNRTPGVDTEFFQMAWVTSASMLARFGLMLLIAFFLYRLWHRTDRRHIFQTWGISRGGHSIAGLLGMGVLLYAVTLLPLQIIWTINEVVPLGEGLATWQILSEVGARPDFIVFLLFTSVLLPPLLEEPIARGYARSRTADAFGPMGGIVLSASIFTLAHGQYFEANFLLLSVIPVIIYATIAWAFVTWKTGSIIPAVVAHALMNTPFPRNVVFYSGMLVVMIALILAYRTSVQAWFNDFFRLWRETDAKGAILAAVAFVAAVLASIVFLQVLTLVWLLALLVIAILGHVLKYRDTAAAGRPV